MKKKYTKMTNYVFGSVYTITDTDSVITYTDGLKRELGIAKEEAHNANVLAAYNKPYDYLKNREDAKIALNKKFMEYYGREIRYRLLNEPDEEARRLAKESALRKKKELEYEFSIAWPTAAYEEARRAAANKNDA